LCAKSSGVDGVLIHKSYFENKYVTTKTYFNNYDAETLWLFSNELFAFRLIKEKTNKKKGGSLVVKEDENNIFFPKFIGYLLNKADHCLFFGTIITKFYNMGNLHDYCKELHNPIFEETDSDSDYLTLEQVRRFELLPFRISQLINVDEQIAKGKFVILI
jgi:hypothetical protein